MSSELVLKTWKISETGAEGTENVVIMGRESGLLAWLLALLKVDPVTSISVNADRVDFSQASLAGTQSRLIPLQNVCSTYYGYHKPWKAAAMIVAFSLYLGLTLTNMSAVLGLLVILLGAGAGVGYYFLNRSLTLGFVEHSGVVSGIKFKRSLIENVDIDGEQAREVCALIQRLIERKEKRMLDTMQP